MTTTAPGYPAPGTPFRDQLKTGDSLFLEAALCAWEWMIEQRWRNERDDANVNDPEWKLAFNAIWENYGSSAMRHGSMQAGAIVLSVWDHMESQGYEFTTSYDWEFVPAVLVRLDWDSLMQDNQYNGKSYWPDPAPILAAMIEDSPNDFAKDGKPISHPKRIAWFTEARRYAKHIWCYEELIDDHASTFECAFFNREDVYATVEAVGEKYNLSRADQDWGINDGKKYQKRSF